MYRFLTRCGVLPLCNLGSTVHSMELAAHGNTIILSGPVVGTELVMVKDAFAANPKIDLVVLRNSHGGEAWTGYRVGEFFRDAGVTTAVSGYCISSCSRMFPGGKQRLFTDDFPADRHLCRFSWPLQNRWQPGPDFRAKRRSLHLDTEILRR